MIRMRGALARLVGAAIVLIACAAIAVVVIRRTASLPTIYEVDTRLWFLELKLRGELPRVGWGDAIRLMGPEWTRRGRFDVAHEVGRGAAPCPVQWETPLGRFWGGENDGRELDLLALEQVGGDIYERRDVAVRDSDVVVDVGAHLGTFTRLALQRGARVVVAVEPNPVNVACLERTFASEIAARRVRVVSAAAWHSPGSLTFEFGDSSQMGHVGASGVEGARAKALPVRAVTLDQLVGELKLDRVDFIKMDIEGAERHALAGASRLLAEHKPRLAICIYHAPDDREVVPRVIRSANDAYETFTRGGFQAYFY
jgi:FkbM family methyltransferase